MSQVMLCYSSPSRLSGARAEEWEIGRITRILDVIHPDTSWANVRIAIETTAGQGTAIGCIFFQIGRIFGGVKGSFKAGVLS